MRSCLKQPRCNQKLVNIYKKLCYSPAGRSVLGETVPEVLSTQTEGTISPNPNRPRPVNNIFIFFPTEIQKFQENFPSLSNLCVLK